MYDFKIFAYLTRGTLAACQTLLISQHYLHPAALVKYLARSSIMQEINDEMVIKYNNTNIIIQQFNTTILSNFITIFN